MEKTDESMGVSQLLGNTFPGCFPPKVYDYDQTTHLSVVRLFTPSDFNRALEK